MPLRSLPYVLGCLLIASAVTARDLVVDNLHGSDAQNDRGLVAGPATYGPYRTINRALVGARSGDRIVLTDTGQPYRECISLSGARHSGSEDTPFEIVGNGATLDGTVAPAMSRWQAVGGGVWELIDAPPGHALLLSPGPGIRRVAPADGGNLDRLEPLSWMRVGPRLYFRPEAMRGPFDYPLEVTDQTTGITLYDVHNVVIRDLVVRGYRIDGINAHDRVRDVVLVNVVSRQNGRSGITVAGASRVTIGATLCEQNGQSQLRVEGRGIASLGVVDFAEESAPSIVTEDAGRVTELPRP